MILEFIASFTASPLGGHSANAPWAITAEARGIVAAMIAALPAEQYVITDGVAVHRMAQVTAGAVLQGPAIIGTACFIGPGAMLRGGVWLAPSCVVGPGVEIKSSFLFPGVRAAHFNFIGDSIIGADVNFEAGSIIANRRNERAGNVRVLQRGHAIDTGHEKFGALVGDGARIGANAVLAPGTLLPARAVVNRLQLIDQDAG